MKDRRARLHWNSQGEAGVTLVESAVVLLLFGVLLTGGVSFLDRYMDTRHVLETQDLLRVQLDAIEGYAAAYRRLPGVDTDGNGREDMVNLAGGLPYVDLALRGTDAWGNPVLYDAQARLVESPGSREAFLERLTQRDGSPRVRVDGGQPFPVAAVIVSPGPDGEIDSTGVEARIYEVYETTAPPPGNDDLVVFLGPLSLYERLGGNSNPAKP